MTMLGVITIPTENLIAFWEVVFNQPLLNALANFLAMRCTIFIDMVNGENFYIFYATTIAVRRSA